MITFPLLLSVIAKMQNTICAFLLSCPVRGTWIEISTDGKVTAMKAGRAPYGARGLKLLCRAQLPPRLLVVPRTGHVD